MEVEFIDVNNVQKATEIIESIHQVSKVNRQYRPFEVLALSIIGDCIFASDELYNMVVDGFKAIAIQNYSVTDIDFG